MLSPEFLEQKFTAAETYDEHVARGNEQQRTAWTNMEQQVSLSDAQRVTLGGFTREMKVLVSSGVWCGDCSQQLPFLKVIADASPASPLDAGRKAVDLRFVDRDEHKDLAERVMICGGMRVPVTIFMAEDFAPVSIFGDRTITRYRAIAERQLGAACAVPGAPVPDDEAAGTLADWLEEVERVHLVLRLSARLRDRHGD
jgi:hypothetical protein